MRVCALLMLTDSPPTRPCPRPFVQVCGHHHHMRLYPSGDYRDYYVRWRLV